MSLEPTPPTNVQVVLRDGREIPVECIYTGVEDGVHMWAAVYVLPDLVTRMEIEVLPPRTGIRVSQFDPRAGHC